MQRKFLNSEDYGEIRKKIKNHQLWLRGDKDNMKGDFSNLDFTREVFHPEYENYGMIYYNIFEGENLNESNFRNSNVNGTSFTNTNLKGADFRGAEFEFSQFSDKQKKEIIFTDKDFEKYQLRREIEKENLEEENKELKEENKELKEENKEKEVTLGNVNELKTEKLVVGFEKLKKEFEKEEKIWLMMSYLSFFTTFGMSITLIIDLFIPELTGISFLYIFSSVIVSAILIPYILTINENEKKGSYNRINFKRFNLKNIKEDIVDFIFSYPNKQLFKKYLTISFLMFFILVISLKLELIRESINQKNSPIFDFSNPYYSLFPLSLVLFSFLYFSIHQYSKAKNLRIENQNKIALLYGFEAIKTDTTPDIDKGKFYDKVADVVFTKVFENKQKEQSLPIDQVFDIAGKIAGKIK